jgi:hypothetical protein
VSFLKRPTADCFRHHLNSLELVLSLCAWLKSRKSLVGAVSMKRAYIVALYICILLLHTEGSKAKYYDLNFSRYSLNISYSVSHKLTLTEISDKLLCVIKGIPV